MLNTAIPLEERPDENHLLACLPPAIQARWLPHLEWVDLELRRVLHEALAPLTHVYFPATAIVSLLYVMENGASAEIAVVGNDGTVGFALPWGLHGRTFGSPKKLFACRRYFACRHTGTDFRNCFVSNCDSRARGGLLDWSSLAAGNVTCGGSECRPVTYIKGTSAESCMRPRRSSRARRTLARMFWERGLTRAR